MSYSANEVMALGSKAARGGGAPPGQALDFGHALLVHLLQDRPEEVLVQALDALPTGPILEVPLALLGIMARETTAADLEGRWDSSLVQSYVETLAFAQEMTVTNGVLQIEIDLSQPNQKPVQGRVHLPDTLLQQLNVLAAYTLVPETEASRLSGAGAGLTDND